MEEENDIRGRVFELLLFEYPEVVTFNLLFWRCAIDRIVKQNKNLTCSTTSLPKDVFGIAHKMLNDQYDICVKYNNVDNFSKENMIDLIIYELADSILYTILIHLKKSCVSYNIEFYQFLSFERCESMFE
ncbi:hypothetical protein RF11_14329 [Thelohanellus kitauei]|uniref:Uncharacterized protein n=1 Tax=Thelohanellus kitauei TaxID=669202 RepID=A0A0C2MTV1_THEKT|nr:hypothetical protein RF11_14329 [Thelohanellus kitauei]